MNEKDKEKFAALMTGIAELYNKKISKALLTIYWNTLQAYEFSEIEQAMNAHVKDGDVGRFMPKPADVTHRLEGTSEITALQAYSKVESAIRKIGSYSTVAFDDPLIHIVVEEMGGWVHFCNTRTEQVPFQTHEFVKRYSAYLQRRPQRYPRYLQGIFHETTPVLVGDREKAKQVVQQGNEFTLPIYRDDTLRLTQSSTNDGKIKEKITRK